VFKVVYFLNNHIDFAPDSSFHSTIFRQVDLRISTPNVYNTIPKIAFVFAKRRCAQTKVGEGEKR